MTEFVQGNPDMDMDEKWNPSNNDKMGRFGHGIFIGNIHDA